MNGPNRFNEDHAYMRLDKPKLLSEALKQFLDRYPHQKKLRQGMVRAQWPKVVGPKIAEQTSDLYFQGNTLVCVVPNAVWRHEIHSNRYHIVQRLNEAIDHKVVHELRVSAY